MDTDPMAELPAELKQNMTRYRAPPGLHRRIRHMLAQQSPGASFADKARAFFTQWLPLGASFACGAVLAATVLIAMQAPAGGDEAVEQQVVASHVRSLMAAHVTDVASTDQHTVKPWFNGKLDYAPTVIDLAAQGFPLIGGRLDYVRDRPVAALVYQRRNHTINVFVLPASDTRPFAAKFDALHGYQVVRWNHAGMRFWAVSDLSEDEMAKFAAAMQAGA